MKRKIPKKRVINKASDNGKCGFILRNILMNNLDDFAAGFNGKEKVRSGTTKTEVRFEVVNSSRVEGADFNVCSYFFTSYKKKSFLFSFTCGKGKW